MATNINDFKLFVEYCANKVQVGGYVSPSQFNMLANRAQMQVFEKDYQTYLQTKNIPDFLKTFLKNTVFQVPPTTAIYSAPSDFEHVAAMRRYAPGSPGIEIPVEETRDESWGELQRSQLLKPTLQFPKYMEFGSEFRFLPKNIGIIKLDYFKTPVAPVWGYVYTSGRPVYDSATSTDFEFPESYLNSVASNYLALIGVNLKDGELSAFANDYQLKTNSAL